MIEKLSKNIYWVAAACIAVVCVVVTVAVAAMSPQRKAIRAVDSRIREIEQVVINRKTNGYGGDISGLKEKLSSAQKDLGRYVISPEQASDLTVDIGKIAQQAGVKGLHSTNKMQNSYGPINECRHIREGRIQLQFEGSFPQFAGFINSLERNEPVIFVDYFKIKRSTADNGRHEVEMVLTFFCAQDSLTDIMGTGDFLK